MSADAVGRAAEFKNDPLTLAEVLASSTADVTDGLHVYWLGEDVEYAFIPFEPGTPERPHGSGDLTDARLARALADGAWGSGDVDDYANGWQEAWVLVTPHMDGCRDDLENDESCGCVANDEWEWWAHRVEAGTRGAFRAMWWSA